MLEFWVDPESPYYKPVFTEDKTYILYCQADWRGVLAAATLKEMGLPNVLHLAGGFSEWKKVGAPTAAKPEKKKRSGDRSTSDASPSTATRAIPAIPISTNKPPAPSLACPIASRNSLPTSPARPVSPL